MLQSQFLDNFLIITLIEMSRLTSTVFLFPLEQAKCYNIAIDLAIVKGFLPL